LDSLQRELLEALKNPSDAKNQMSSKKLMFKVYRDKARLFALKREEQNAHDSHKKAERILKEELVVASSSKKSLNLSMRIEVSVKIAKLQLLKGLWISKFGYEKSIDEMMEAYHLFSDAIGDEKNYFGANCQLEIGSNYLRLKNAADASAILTLAVEILESIFGEDHPLIQKYYNYSSEVYSYSNDDASMLSMA
jgi:hypothetical protein